MGVEDDSRTGAPCHIKSLIDRVIAAAEVVMAWLGAFDYRASLHLFEVRQICFHIAQPECAPPSPLVDGGGNLSKTMSVAATVPGLETTTDE